MSNSPFGGKKIRRLVKTEAAKDRGGVKCGD